MQRYFLTVGDKNPIMFNDMLCECAWVESGLQLRGGIFKNLLYGGFEQPRCTNVCADFHMCMFLSWWSSWRLEDFLRKTVSFSWAHQTCEELHERLIFWIAQLKSCPSQTSMFFCQVFMVLSELCLKMIIHTFHASNNVALKHFLVFIYWVRRLICHT